MKFIITIILFISPLFINSQSTSIYFNEEFDDNRNKWEETTESNGTFDGISASKYIIKSENTFQTWFTLINHPIDQSKDFIIETNILCYRNTYKDYKSQGFVNSGYGIMWGSNSWKNSFDFIINNINSTYSISKWTNGFPKAVISNKLAFEIKKDEYNKLKILKEKQTISFFINDKFIYKSPFEPFWGDDIGFIVYGTFWVEIDNLRISYISPDKTPPEIIVTSPNVSRGFKPIVENKQITIKGNVKDESGIFEVLINDEEAQVNSDGSFSKTILLAFGDNAISIKATDIKQNTNIQTFTMERKSNQQDVLVINNQKNNNEIRTGKYYALIIGVSSYSDPKIPSLDNLPIKDAENLSNTLIANYTFEKENVTLLVNPNRYNIIKSFDQLSKKITPEDNLIIFYAGHGYYDVEKEIGYWLPSDAEMDYTANWIYNSTLVDNIKGINSKHTLLISDACFSGSIFKTRSLPKNAPAAIQKKYELKSRNAIASGTLKTVPNKSVFIKYLLDRLQNNSEKYFSASQLFQSIEIPVGNNSSTIPQFGDIQNVGDEGGDFIFIRK